MVYQFVSWALGPSGVRILEWYAEHNLIINGMLVAVALVAMAFPRQRDQITAVLRDVWWRTPFALPEEDRRLVEQYKAKRRAAMTKKGNTEKDENG